MSPTLSVVLPNFNHARFIGEALKAITGQSLKPHEVIVIDDASTDNSVEVIQGFAMHWPFVKLVQNPKNAGVVYSCNRGIRMASGDYVLSSAADDIILPGLLEKSIALLAQYPQAGLCSTGSLLIGEHGEDKGSFHLPDISDTACFISPENAIKLLKRHGGWFMGNTTIYRRQAFLDAGGFIPELHSFSDGFISLVIALKHGVCFIPEPLAAWRRMGGGYSSQTAVNTKMALSIIDHAEHLMETVYKDIFPAEYALQCQRRLFFDFFDAWARSQRAGIAGLRTRLPSPTIVDRVFFNWMIVLRWIDYGIIKIYLFSRLRFSMQWEILKRKFKISL